MPSPLKAPPAGKVRTLAVWTAAAGTVIIWGGSPVVTRVAVDIVDPLLVGLMRTILAGIVAVPIALMMRLPAPGLSAPRNLRRTALLILAAVSGFVGYPILVSFGLEHTTASNAGLIMACLPVLTASIAFAVDRQMPPLAWCGGALIAFAGEFALIHFRFGAGEGESALLGDLLVFAACCCAATGYVAGARLSRHVSSWSTTFWGVGLGALLVLPILIFMGGVPMLGDIGWHGWLALLYLALVVSVVAYVAWYWALANGGEARAGGFQFAQPLVTVALAVGFLNEPLTPALILTGLAILAGIAIIQWGGPRARPAS